MISKSLYIYIYIHRKWLFHQTSILNWLFGVPGIYLETSHLGTFKASHLGTELRQFHQAPPAPPTAAANREGQGRSSSNCLGRHHRDGHASIRHLKHFTLGVKNRKKKKKKHPENLPVFFLHFLGTLTSIENDPQNVQSLKICERIAISTKTIYIKP